MSDKTLRASLYFLGGVTVLYLLVTLLKGGGGGAPTDDSGLAAVLGELDGEWLTRVELSGPDDAIDLSKDGGVWTVNGFEADSAAVARFLRAVDEVEVGPVAATNPANHERMGVTAESAWTMTVDGTTTVLLGNSGNRYRTFYARLPEADEVSLVEGDLRSAATRSLFDWRNKVMVRADTAAVMSVRVTRDGTTTLYERQDSVWTADGEDVDGVTIRDLLQELAGLRASGFAPQDAVMPESPDRSVQALDADGNEIASVQLAEQESNFRASSPASPYIFEIANFRADRIAPEPPDDEG
ncbi:MAG: DUF4340 domain-containing protein [Gemmatimonadota bacterium]|nr:DUF4340 domain-containing protein [Gemmatimonadota bacterium]